MNRLRSVFRLALPAARAKRRPAATLLRLLGQLGIVSDLKLGVRREDGRVEGHAWVELEGTAINEPSDPDEDFRPLKGGGADPLALVGRAQR